MPAIVVTQDSELKQIGEELETKRKKGADILAEARAGDGKIDLSRIKSIDGTPEQKAAELQRMQQELAVLGVGYEAKFWERRLSQLQDAAAKFADPLVPMPGGGTGPGGSTAGKSFGALFVESDAFKARQKNGPGPVKTVGEDIEVKTLLQTSAGWAPQSIRTGRLVDDAQRPVQVLDLIPQGETDQAAVVYMEETTFTNNAAEVAEAAAYAEAALAYTERTSNVRKVGVSLPVTDEQLSDVPQIRGLIDNRLVFMLRQRLDSQVLNGNGVAPNLAGILNVAGIQTTAKAAGEPEFDTMYRAQRLVRITGRALANGYVLHPNDWETQRLKRTTEGVYLLGNPNQPGPAMIWGLPVAEGDVIAENTGLAGAFSTMSELVYRRGIEVQVGWVNDDFLKGKQTLRADLRVAFPVYRPEAFTTGTGL